MKKSKLFKPKSTNNKQFTKKRLYDTPAWSEYRLRFLRENPLCYACGVSARVVDHVVSAKGDEKLFWNITNFIPLCKPCHDYITNHYDRHVVADTEGKMKWLAFKREQTNTSVRVKIVLLNPQKT